MPNGGPPYPQGFAGGAPDGNFFVRAGGGRNVQLPVMAETV